MHVSLAHWIKNWLMLSFDLKLQLFDFELSLNEVALIFDHISFLWILVPKTLELIISSECDVINGVPFLPEQFCHFVNLIEV